jgi:hypothetical protein
MSSNLPPSLKAKILAQAKSEPALKRDAWERKSSLVLAAGMLISLAALLALGGVKIGARSGVYFSLVALFWTSLAFAGIKFGFGRGKSSVGASQLRLASLTLGLPVGALLTVTALSYVFPNEAIGAPRHDGACAVLSIALGIAPLAGYVLARRNTVLVRRRLTAASVGAASGTLGCMLMVLKCPCSELAHLLLGHVAPIVALAVLGALLGEKLLGRLTTSTVERAR